MTGITLDARVDLDLRVMVYITVMDVARWERHGTQTWYIWAEWPLTL